MNKLHLGFEDITKIYAEALENETGLPVNNLANVFDYDSYDIKYDSLSDKITIKIYICFANIFSKLVFEIFIFKLKTTQ